MWVQIFLAIIVDAYATVKQHTEASQGLVEEMTKVAFHGLKRRVMPNDMFLSDQELLHHLSELHTQLEEEEKKAQQKAVNKIKGPKERVLVPGGADITPLALARMLQQAKALPQKVCIRVRVMSLTVSAKLRSCTLGAQCRVPQSSEPRECKLREWLIGQTLCIVPVCLSFNERDACLQAQYGIV